MSDSQEPSNSRQPAEDAIPSDNHDQQKSRKRPDPDSKSLPETAAALVRKNAKTPLGYKELMQLSSLLSSLFSCFRALPFDRRKRFCQAVHFQHLYANSTLCRQYESAERFYLILSGTVEVTVDGLGVVSTIGALDTFGEIGIINNEPRSASCTTKSLVDCLFLNKQEYLSIFLTGNEDAIVKQFQFLCTNVRAFKNCTKKDCVQFCERLTETSFPQDTIFPLDEGDCIFFLGGGDASFQAWTGPADARPVMRTRLSEKTRGHLYKMQKLNLGDMIGESIVFHDAKRATGWLMVSESEIVLLRIAKEHFMQMTPPSVLSLLRDETLFRMGYMLERHGATVTRKQKLSSTRTEGAPRGESRFSALLLGKKSSQAQEADTQALPPGVQPLSTSFQLLEHMMALEGRLPGHGRGFPAVDDAFHDEDRFLPLLPPATMTPVARIRRSTYDSSLRSPDSSLRSAQPPGASAPGAKRAFNRRRTIDTECPANAEHMRGEPRGLPSASDARHAMRERQARGQAPNTSPMRFTPEERATSEISSGKQQIFSRTTPTRRLTYQSNAHSNEDMVRPASVAGLTRMRYTPDTCKRLWRARTPDPTDDPDVPSNLTAPAQYIRYLKRKCLREEYGSESFERFE
ncbi:hypothetical protein CYMTET_53454 [Cymbomonas tetramitiformis]|uniref:Cyclic nucleotide-binding domain-containing protein n=1 Tax=Cymbomonas tetramitiformis TaxID=36881 RepID=A0AAE0EPQ0_9CHLO|nr:hypothetical protein CYMTET_53454 [Cymbomonas tetramitiformis]